MIICGIGAVAFVWLLIPGVPDAEPDPDGAGSAISSAAPAGRCEPVHSWLFGEALSEKSIGAARILKGLREDLLERIESVRADLRAHEVRGSKSAVRGTIFS